MARFHFRTVCILCMVLCTIALFHFIYTDRNNTQYTLDRLRVFMIGNETNTTNRPIPPVNHRDMEERLDLQRKACRHLNNITEIQTIRSLKTAQQHKQKITYLKKYNISYCVVGKAGNTFIKQLFLVLMEGGELTKTLQNQSRIATHTAIEKYNVMFSSTSWRHSRLVTVTRNPYTRLFSAYIDRVTIPSITGPIRSGSNCKYDVTFQEFLEIVVQNTKRGIFNIHWSPMYYTCRSCEVSPTFIGKLESLTKDIEYISENLNISKKMKSMIESKLSEPRLNWTITGIIKNAFEISGKSFLGRGCIGWLGALGQLWKAFQVQGYIHETIELPTGLFNKKDLNVDLFVKTVLSTIHENPMSKKEQKDQRQRALVKAYSEVDKRIIEEIKRVYRPDFEMYGYSKEPPSHGNI